jgi:CheY-like chemotaxis protein
MTLTVKRASSLKTSILISFRHSGLRKLIASQLVGEGYKVLSVDTLEEAITQIHHGRIRPALLVLDTLHQPLTLAAMDSLPSWLPLMVCSGPLDRGGPLLSQRPMTMTLQKPFTLGELVDGVHKICYKGGSLQRMVNAR